MKAINRKIFQNISVVRSPLIEQRSYYLMSRGCAERITKKTHLNLMLSSGIKSCSRPNRVSILTSAIIPTEGYTWRLRSLPSLMALVLGASLSLVQCLPLYSRALLFNFLPPWTRLYNIQCRKTGMKCG